MGEFISHHAEVLDALTNMESDSFDGGLSDVPYGLGTNQPTAEELIAYLGGAELDTGGDFMAADWHVPSVHTWKEIFRVLKPGAYIPVFAAPRTVDIISIGIRAAGFEVRDVITFAWVFGSGFPKSQDASKALDAAAGAVRDVVGEQKLTGTARIKGGSGYTVNAAAPGAHVLRDSVPITAASTDLAKEWDGFGSALKPAFEPVILARKPLIGTLAENIRVHGTGALAIDASRIATDWSDRSESWKRSGHSAQPNAEKIAAPPGNGIECHPGGRWPANVVLDEVSADMLDMASGERRTHGGGTRAPGGNGFQQRVVGSNERVVTLGPGDVGGASRFFYIAKASREERDLGCESLPFRSAAEMTDSPEDSARLNSPRTGAGRTSGARNYHPNVKPVDLTRWLAGLILPPARRDGTRRRLLVPYAGSGSEMIGALLAGWDLVEGIEREPRPSIPDSPDYQSILRARVQLAIANPRAFEPYADRKADKPLEGQRSLFGDIA